MHMEPPTVSRAFPEKWEGPRGRDRRACTFMIAMSPPEAPPTLSKIDSVSAVSLSVHHPAISPDYWFSEEKLTLLSTENFL